MNQSVQSAPPVAVQVSQLVLSDRLLTLAQDADRAGFGFAARRLLSLAYSVFDETPGHA